MNCFGRFAHLAFRLRLGDETNDRAAQAEVQQIQVAHCRNGKDPDAITNRPQVTHHKWGQEEGHDHINGRRNPVRYNIDR